MNKSRRITFGHLEAVLKELGFRKKVVPGKGVAYKHEQMKPLLLLRLHKANEFRA